MRIALLAVASLSLTACVSAPDWLDDAQTACAAGQIYVLNQAAVGGGTADPQCMDVPTECTMLVTVATECDSTWNLSDECTTTLCGVEPSSTSFECYTGSDEVPWNRFDCAATVNI